eukprot:gene4148-5907_t
MKTLAAHFMILLISCFLFKFWGGNEVVENNTSKKRYNYSMASNFNFVEKESNRKECILLKRSYNVAPGKSWGKMDINNQNRWMNLKCDGFFCKKNKLAGKGVYNCIPVTNSRINENVNQNQDESKSFAVV